VDSTDAAGFTESLLKFAKLAEDNMEKVIRKACIDLYRLIAERTPVDTGRAKASWGLSTCHAEDVAAENQDGYSVNEISQMIQDNVTDFKFDIHDDKVVIYNNLEYISALESGHSKVQAPAGMVAISLAEFETFFNQALVDLDGVS